MNEIFESIAAERQQQDKKWGVQNHTDGIWLAILMEEVGEAASIVIPHPRGYGMDLQKELIQVAAVCVAWLQCLKRRDEGRNKP